MVRWLKRLGLALFAGALIAAMVYALLPQPVPVDLAVVDRGPLTVTIDEEGIARIRDVYSVSAPIAGRVDRIDLEVGDPVVAGETIVAAIRPVAPPFIDERARRERVAAVDAATAAVALAEANVNRAQAELRLADSDLERARRLAETKTVSARALEKAIIDVETRRAELRRAEADLGLRRSELESARASLLQPGDPLSFAESDTCCVTVRAPADGRVLTVYTESERVVAAGTELAEIGDPADLEVVVDLLSKDAVRIAPGSRAWLTDWGGARDLPATVRRIDPAGYTKVSALGIEEQRVDVVLDLAAEDEAFRRLGHNFRVFVRIVAWHADNVVRLPLAALFRNGNDWAVFAMEGGVARLRRLEIGQRNMTHVEVVNGISAGQPVVLYPSDAVHDGVAVAPRDGAAP